MQYWKALRAPRRAATAVLWATFALAACDTLPSEPDTPAPLADLPERPSGAVATVEVTPGAVALAVAATVQLRALARDTDGRLITVRTATWTSSDSEIADVSDSGLVTARAQGEAWISATIAGKRGSARVSVIPGVKEPPDDDDRIRLPH